MPRRALTVLLLAAATATAAGLNPHLDPVLVPAGCAACHRGHGVSRSPMLPSAQREVCLTCHGSRTSADEAVARGVLSPTARPSLLSTLLSLPFTHPLGDAFSRREAGTVTCTSCHSPHRGLPALRPPLEPSGRQNISPRDPTRMEFELCESCHGSAGVKTQSLTDISRRLNPNSRSYHPVEALSTERSPSAIRSLVSKMINCTDCHGSADPSSPRGPHASSVPFLLRAPYSSTDGAADLSGAYALCFRCHVQKGVLESAAFPKHGEHIRGIGASCATCHDPHGSVRNRALIRFGEQTSVSGVSPSASGRLAFVSAGPGVGACYLTCHGKNHDPLGYGPFESKPGVPVRPFPARPAGARKMRERLDRDAP